MFKKLISIFVLCGVSAVASAHPGHGESGFVAAFMHPFTGLDHLLMMLFIGVWAGSSGGATRWRLPVLFLSGMFGGWLLGSTLLNVWGVIIPGLDSGIAATLIVLGVLLAGQIRLQPVVQMTVVVLFALLHGLAHGEELSTGSAWLSAAGLLSATALLHGIGLLATQFIPPQRSAIYRGAGAALALIGGGLLAAI